jgi:hypothetical protein
MNEVYEVHIAVSRIPQILHEQIFTALAKVGITKHKYCYQVVNNRDFGQVSQTGIPTRHDLPELGSMSTERVATYDEAHNLALIAMAILAQFQVKGNFEIETLLTDNPDGFENVSILEFPGFELVPNSPHHETHLIFKNGQKGERFPSPADAIKFFRMVSGVEPHQLVDFGGDYAPTEETIVSRVVTLYLPNREAALEMFSKVESELQRLKDSYAFGNNPLAPLPKPSRWIAERVLLVGQPIS